jgi:predicted transcriptional regulator
MGQAEVLAYLTEHRGKRFTDAELQAELGGTVNRINLSVTKLKRWGLVQTELTPIQRYYEMYGEWHTAVKHIRKVWVA